MSSSDLPCGRLTQVRRDWDYQGGWVRAPLAEIVFNNRLTKQARLLWLWLAAIHPSAQNISWADCEAAMACGTKARRSCLSQLVEEGFLSIGENGIVTIHDPYSVYQEQPEDSIPSVKFEFDYIGEDFPRTECGESKKIKASSDQIIKEKSDLPELHKLQMKQEIITTWNEYKPASYSKIRTISDKQLQAVLKHLKNLGLKTSSIPEFIQAISKGIVNSDFWLNKVDQSGRNFSAIFGYGNAQDTKMRNVESLYALAEEATQTKEPVGLYDASQNELIRTFKYVSFEYEKACNRSNQADIAKWQNHLGSLKLQLAEAGINLEEI